MTGQYSCGTCKTEVKNEDLSIQCDLCNKSNCVLCVNISSAKYGKLKLSTLPWYCLICANEIPFSSLSNREFNIFLSRNPLHHSAPAIPSKKIDKRTKEILKKLKDLNQLFDHTENTVSCDYLDICDFQARLFSFTFKHIIIAHINQLKTSQVDTKFDIISISESRISKKNHTHVKEAGQTSEFLFGIY